MLHHPEPPAPGDKPAWAFQEDALRVDRFVLGPELGRGGMGRVHLAWDPLLKRCLALKLLLGEDPDHHLRLLKEAQAQARVEHPAVCRVHELGVFEGRPYIAMQLIRGKPLSELRLGLDFHALAGILADVAGAVHAAHKASLIHRDLKPANILVEGPEGADPKPYVVDFGLVRDLSLPDHTLSWAVLGTPAFMSPEQATGESLGPASDIYSLGATLYAMLAGQPPFEGSTLGGLLTSQMASAAPPVRRFRPDVPRDLETIALKCLEMEPLLRYDTAFALEEDLRRFVAGEPIRARPLGPVGRLHRWIKRNPKLATSLVAGLLVAGLLGAWNLHTLRQARLREAAAQRFALEIRDAEHLLRFERMMPVHDMRPAEARLRHRMEVIRRDMLRQGPVAEGPGRYALGRGLMAMRDFPAAIQELESAWNGGYRAPEVAQALGRAHMAMYLDSLPASIASDFKDIEATQRVAHLEPALAWFTKSQGVQVENTAYDKGLLAMANRQHDQAEACFRQALEESPWLHEVWVDRALNLVRGVHSSPLREGRIPAPDTSRKAIREGLAMLEKAQAMAPSHLPLHVTRAELWGGLWGLDSARGSRDPAPLAKANECLVQARQISPEDETLLIMHSHMLMQQAFHQLSSGGDPARESLAMAETLGRWLQEGKMLKAESRQVVLGHQHHHLWIAAETHWRFGRDPRGLLAEAARMRALAPGPDPHHGFTLELEALDLMARGQDPTRPLEEGQGVLRRFMEALPEQRNNFFPQMILGELHGLQAEWLHRQGRDPGPALRRALDCLRLAVAKDPSAAFPYYTLPRVLALAVRNARARGQDPAPYLAEALAAARRGQAINPRNAQIQQAAATAYLAQAEAALDQGQDAAPVLDQVRQALRAARTANPRDFRAFLLQAHLETLAARHAQVQGADPEPHLARSREAARKGLRIKGDEPGFGMYLKAPASS